MSTPIDPGKAPKGVDQGVLITPPDAAAVPDDSLPIDPAAGIDNINHVIFVVQENRSFDEYFGTFPGADDIAIKDGVPTTCAPIPPGRAFAVPRHRPL